MDRSHHISSCSPHILRRKPACTVHCRVPKCPRCLATSGISTMARPTSSSVKWFLYLRNEYCATYIFSLHGSSSQGSASECRTIIPLPHTPQCGAQLRKLAI